jgi:hypothetical protein
LLLWFQQRGLAALLKRIKTMAATKQTAAALAETNGFFTEGYRMTDAARFQMIVTVCADSVRQLRGCDVDRALGCAEDAGILDGFCSWLAKKRPDLAGRIADARGGSS